MGDCADVLDLVPETVVLVFDVTGLTTPDDAKRVMAAKEIEKLIGETLKTEAMALAKKHNSGKEVTKKDVLKMTESAGSRLLKNRKNKFEKRAKCAYEASPLGAWVSENMDTIMVVVPILAGSALAGMYIAKVGDGPAQMAADKISGKSKDWTIKKVGTITVSAKDIKLKPSKSVVSGMGVTKMKLKKIPITMEVAAGTTYDEKAGKQKFKGGLKMRAADSYEFKKKSKITYSLGAETDHKLDWMAKGTTSLTLKDLGATGTTIDLSGHLAYDRFGLLSTGGKAGVGFIGSMGKSTKYSVDLEARYKQLYDRPAQPAQQEVSGALMFKIYIP